MEKNPAVSVVVPIYNVERYIKFCVDSILAQRFQDFEVILIDDVSPDNSFELCQKLYGDNPKVKIVRHEKNLGLGEARNTGIKHALGKYVYFVDSDDFLFPDALEKFYRAAELNNAQVVHAAGRYELVQNANEPVGEGTLTLKWEDWSQEGFLKNDVRYRLDKHWRTYATRSNAWLCFCRRDFLSENCIEFLPIISEDEPFSVALYCKAERFYILHAAFYVHLLRGGSIMRSYNVKRLAQGIQAMLLGAAYVEKLLNQISKFDGFKAWCESVMETFFGRFSRNHTLPFYSGDKVLADVNETVEKALTPVFSENETFVRYFFNAFHTVSKQKDSILQKAGVILEQNRRLVALPQFLAREQQGILSVMEKIRSAEKRIFVVGTPLHGNLGDHAIVWAELKFLKTYFPDRVPVELPSNYITGELSELFWGLGWEKFVRECDVIFLHGGGNLGNLWTSQEYIRRKMIERFRDKKLVIFPQSVHFTADADGRRELEQSRKIYNAHPDLHLMLRDEESFRLAKKIFPNVHTYLLPDVVTVMHGLLDDINLKREGVLFILRRDKEKVRDDDKIKILQEALAEANIPFDIIDTVIGERVTSQNRESKIRAVLTKIRGSKLVVTDRFHGVVFSFITRTPVMAFKSLDTKISSGIEWFENAPSVFYAEKKTWAQIEAFLNRALDDDIPLAEMDTAIKFDNMNLFTGTLNQIVGSRESVSVNVTTPPPPTRIKSSASKRDNQIVKIFTLHIPVSACNFRCHYCYLAQRPEHYQGLQPQMKYSPEQVARALSKKRLGGKAVFNICAQGETLLFKELDAYLKPLVKEGHFLEIVTNCVITPMLDKILAWDKELLAQVEFKCSFHWLELKRHKMLDLFARNVNKIWDAGASATVEITPSDELIPHIAEIKEFSLKNFGALPHITIARDDRTRDIDILSSLPKEEYYKVWEQFDSPFFDYKTTIFGKRQEEFCYAGLWSAWVDMSTGLARPCYCGRSLGDIFAEPDSEFPSYPACKCTLPHCYNGHFWLTFGNIPDATPLTYADMRNRIRSDGREWLQPKLKTAWSSKLRDVNRELSDAEKLQFMIMNQLGL